jgi:hypothetical protein
MSKSFVQAAALRNETMEQWLGKVARNPFSDWHYSESLFFSRRSGKKIGERESSRGSGDERH